MAKAKTTTEIIAAFKQKHGDRYDYSNCVYKNSITKVAIGCKQHGNFEMLPSNHQNGQNCPNCRKTDRTDILRKLSALHKNTYDYRLLTFNVLTDKVKIICPIHKVFEQTLQDHLKGHKCPKCRGLYLTKEELIERLTKVHDGLYIYDAIGENFKTRDKIKIKCRIHGYFMQTVGNHSRGQGCRKCSDSICKRKKKQNPPPRKVRPQVFVLYT